MHRKITVMLVDDHAVVRAGYRLLLSQSGLIEIVREAEYSKNYGMVFYPE